MNILLLGNGFDLRHNLPTKYEDFLQIMRTFQNVFINYRPGYAYQVFDNIESLSNTHLGVVYEKHKSIYDNIEISNDDYDMFRGLSKNYWYKFFDKVYDGSINTWIDFEKEIAYVIDEFKSFFDSLELNDNLFLDDFDIPDYYLIMDLPHVLKVFDYFYYKGKDNHYHIKDEYIFETYKDSGDYEIDLEKIIGDLYNLLFEFSKVLALYLEVFVNRLLQKIDTDELEEYVELFEDFDSVVSFNYTDTYRCFYNRNKNIKNYVPVHNIHGDLLNKNIVLGINPDKSDELDELDTLFIMFKKYYQRVYYGADVSYLDELSTVIKIDKDNHIVVCGHSLDATDKDIIESLFKHAARITIIYHSKEKVGDYIKNLINIYGKSGLDDLRTNSDLRFVGYNELEDHMIFY